MSDDGKVDDRAATEAVTQLATLVGLLSQFFGPLNALAAIEAVGRGVRAGIDYTYGDDAEKVKSAAADWGGATHEDRMKAMRAKGYYS